MPIINPHYVNLKFNCQLINNHNIKLDPLIHNIRYSILTCLCAFDEFIKIMNNRYNNITHLQSTHGYNYVNLQGFIKEGDTLGQGPGGGGCTILVSKTRHARPSFFRFLGFHRSKMISPETQKGYDPGMTMGRYFADLMMGKGRAIKQ